jgi:DNA mismatch endonuclease (patch repair protein)
MPVSPETRAKMSAAQKARVRKPHTEATKAALSAQTAGRWAADDGSWRERLVQLSAAHKGRKRGESTRAKMSLARQRQVLPSKDTKPELATQAWLEARSMSFEKHGYIEGLNHQWDILLRDRRILIEVDGCYWHGCEKCGHIGVNGKPDRDAELDVEASLRGWRVMRIWEHEITDGDFSALSLEP